MNIVEAKASVEVPSGEVKKTTFSLEETLVHTEEVILEIVVAEECVEVNKEYINQTHSREVMEVKNPRLKKLRATTNTEKRA